MKVLLYGINYAPELTGIGKYSGEMAEWLSQLGHDVRVVTAPPYYPEWKVTIQEQDIEFFIFLSIDEARFKWRIACEFNQWTHKVSGKTPLFCNNDNTVPVAL